MFWCIDAQDAARAAGVIPALLAALTAHKLNRDVAEHGCQASGSFAYGNPANQVCVGRVNRLAERFPARGVSQFR